mmetsp:Transcript_15848/g.36525  ORF Transcript_15848/g.36525 Transcript_15848/m.36525 type:complete len:305 (+) Transcript_15848:97-1011(+)
MISYPFKNILAVLLWCVVSQNAQVADAFGVKEPVSALLQKYGGEISALKAETKSIVGDESFGQVPYNNDVFYLRYCLEGKGVDDLKTTLAWRQGEGKAMCDAATTAFQAATADGGWNNDPIRAAAPSADIINQYVTQSTGMTTSSSKGDILYCIRAGKIDDNALMSKISVDDLVTFFLYSKEIIALAANDRSLKDDRLAYVLTVNDLNGLKLIGGDASFRSALGASSKQANELYPSLGGPTLLLNLPKLVSALVKLFTPLFPEKVREKIKFAQGPLKKVDELAGVAPGGKDRASFLADIDAIAY